MTYVLTLGSTDTDEAPIAVSESIEAARVHAVKKLREFINEAGLEGEYTTRRVPYTNREDEEVFGNVHADDDTEYPEAVDWVRISPVPTV